MRARPSTPLLTATVTPVISVAVDITQELGARAASSLLGHPLIDRIGTIGRKPPRSWGHRAGEVAGGRGFDVGIGVDGADVRVHRFAGEGVAWASAVGLARSLERKIGGDAVMAITVPGSPIEAGEAFVFPPPIGWARGTLGEHHVHECPVEGSYAGVTAQGSGGHAFAATDDGLFLSAVCLAAGAIVAGLDPSMSAVWERADDYIDACEVLGLVIAATG